MKARCLRCGYPCESNGFNRSYGCTNASCPFALDVLKWMAEAEKLLKEAGL